MITQIVAVRDNAVEAFTPPVHVPHVGAALREFTTSCNDPSHNFSKHAADYDLWHLGSFDDSTGLFSLPESGQPTRLARALDSKIPS